MPPGPPLARPVLAYNILVLVGLTLAGNGAYLLASTITKRPAVALLSGVIFALALVHMRHVANGHLNIMSVQWALVALTDLYVALYFLLPFLGIFALHHLVEESRRFLQPTFLIKATTACAAALTATLPYYLPTLMTLQKATTAISLRESVHSFGQDWVQLVLPIPWNPVLGSLCQT